MGNDLHGSSKVIPISFFGYNSIIDLSCGKIIILSQFSCSKPFVMPKI